ncbi:transposase family Tnp2 protein [Rhizoctonia solani 123E]|uniref:Transposase family Tnp2 protein n=2 Tax=Rhizoctonia solani AG-3 TaxID=1086053 RepID=A0A074RKM0_9AGAM|nr:transposase family Tnp2 protein [Rhizoctonia solani 123E]
MGLIDADNAGDAADNATTTDDDEENSSEDEDEDEDDDGSLGEDNHMDIDMMADDLFGQDNNVDYNNGNSEMGYHSESDRSTTPSSTGSWLNMPTPPPSLPQTPPPGSDDEEQPSEDEDGFAHITEDDYHEYECWYAEDNILELNEMIAETLTEEEVSSFKMAAIQLFGHISERDYECIRYSFKQHIRLMSIYRVHKRLSQLSGINPITVDCCTNICHAFTGRYADEEVCSTCQHPCFDSNRKPFKVFEYLPTTPRFQGYYNNPDMVKAMRYRHDYIREPGKVDDYIDSTLYSDLRNTKIVVDGVGLGVNFLNRRRDIAYMVMLDGVNIFEKGMDKSATCWPIMAQNMNLPASERVKLRNIIPLGIIPGPFQPKDFDSFLEPFVDEALEQARGVETYDATTGTKFTLRAHPIIITGDMQAIKHITQMKGPNGKRPCRACEMNGVHHTCRKSYYVPLTNPIDKPDAIPDDRLDPDAKPGELTGYDPLDLPLRTAHRINKQLDKIDEARNKTQCDKLETRFGLCGDSILDHIPSIKRPDSYPHEFLHLFLLNHGKELFLLWSGKHKDLVGHPGPFEFVLPVDALVAIGEETKEATKSFPAQFTRAMPNIYTHADACCGESWCTWLIYIGPAVMRGRLQQKYYDHYMELVDILRCLLSVTNTRARIDRLKIEVAHYVQGFEELYYRYQYERLFLCKLTVHAILHVPDDIIRCGPVWVYWSFSMERYCREVTFCVKSKILPYTTISKHVIQLAQVGAISCRFPEIRKALLFGKNDVPVGEKAVSKMEQVYPGSWYKFIPKRCDRWGKLRIADGGDCIRAAKVCNPTSVYGKRDSSFIRFSYEKDENEDDPHAEVKMVTAVGYGRLDLILVITLAGKTPPDDDDDENENEKDKEDKGEDEDEAEPITHVLAQITEAKGVEGDATTELITYRELGRSFVLDIKNVEHVAARVFTRGQEPNGEWVVVDRSQGVARAEFAVNEHGSDEED